MFTQALPNACAEALLLGPMTHLLEPLAVLVLVHLGLPLPSHAVCMHSTVLLHLPRHACGADQRDTLHCVPSSRVYGSTAAAADV